MPKHYSPFRRSTRSRRNFRARLACLNHAASVRSEPGSNPSWFKNSGRRVRPAEAVRTVLIRCKTYLSGHPHHPVHDSRVKALNRSPAGLTDADVPARRHSPSRVSRPSQNCQRTFRGPLGPVVLTGMRLRAASAGRELNRRPQFALRIAEGIPLAKIQPKVRPDQTGLRRSGMTSPPSDAGPRKVAQCRRGTQTMQGCGGGNVAPG